MTGYEDYSDIKTEHDYDDDVSARIAEQNMAAQQLDDSKHDAFKPIECINYTPSSEVEMFLTAVSNLINGAGEFAEEIPADAASIKKDQETWGGNVTHEGSHEEI